jgi:hypothetical protein
MTTGALREVEHEQWHWRECQDCRQDMISTWPRQEPEAPETGQGWYDEESGCVYVWDGAEWVCVPAD